MAVAVSLAIALGVAGCEGDSPPPQASDGGAAGTDASVASDESAAATAEPEPELDSSESPMAASEEAGPDEPGQNEVKLWFMAGEQYLPLERQVAPIDDEPQAAPGPLEAIEALLEGPLPSDEAVPRRASVEEAVDVEPKTLIPDGTEAVGVEVRETGEAVIDLSPRFLAGIPKREGERTAAESRELSARVGQVVHTVTQFAGISSAEVRTGGITIANGSRRVDYAPPRRPEPPETLRPGAEPSGATRRLQQRLAQLRYLPQGSADGIYGEQTAQAVMAFQAWQGLDRDGIAGPATHRELAKAKRPQPAADGPRRRVEIHLDKGVVLLVRGGRTARAIHASGGISGYDTPRGSFEVFRKELMSWSVPYKVWMPYATYFNGGIALHESASVPAYPASHGCVRVPPAEAKLVYNFAGMGTTVVVL